MASIPTGGGSTVVLFGTDLVMKWQHPEDPSCPFHEYPAIRHVILINLYTTEDRKVLIPDLTKDTFLECLQSEPPSLHVVNRPKDTPDTIYRFMWENDLPFMIEYHRLFTFRTLICLFNLLRVNEVIAASSPFLFDFLLIARFDVFLQDPSTLCTWLQNNTMIAKEETQDVLKIPTTTISGLLRPGQMYPEDRYFFLSKQTFPEFYDAINKQFAARVRAKDLEVIFPEDVLRQLFQSYPSLFRPSPLPMLPLVINKSKYRLPTFQEEIHRYLEFLGRITSHSTAPFVVEATTTLLLPLGVGSKEEKEHNSSPPWVPNEYSLPLLLRQGLDGYHTQYPDGTIRVVDTFHRPTQEDIQHTAFFS